MRHLFPGSLIVALLLAAAVAAAPTSARILFYDPGSGNPDFAKAAPSPATGLTPVGAPGVRYVGVHYWFENARGQKFANPSAAGAGSRLRLRLRSNVDAFLTVWMSDEGHESIELTSRSDAGPEGKWTGYGLAVDQVLSFPQEFVVASSGDVSQRVIIFLARSQTEQVASFSGAREKLRRVAAQMLIDGASAVVREVDQTTPGQVGVYVVHRGGGQTGDEIVMTARPPGFQPLDHGLYFNAETGKYFAR